MKQSILLLVYAFLLSSCCSSKFPKSSGNEPPLSEVVAVIQAQYAQANDTLNKNGIAIEIKEADLSLQVSKTSTANADITVSIFKPSSKYIYGQSTKVTYILKKENVQAAKGGRGFIPKGNELRDLIVNAATKFHNINATIGELTQDSFSLDIIFSIEWDNSVTLTFNVFGQGVNAGYEYDKVTQHELVLTFGPIKKI